MDWPKCEWKQGPAQRYCKGGKIVYPGPKPDYISDEPCPKCNGTGERDLTADEAAEYLIYNGLGFSFYPAGSYGKDGEKLGEVAVLLDWDKGEHKGETLTEALNAACRAVRSKG